MYNTYITLFFDTFEIGTNSNWNLNFGICSKSTCSTSTGTYYQGYGWSSAAVYTMNPNSRGNVMNSYGKSQIKKGDYVDMYLDMNKRKLRYMKNGKDLGDAYPGQKIPKDKYRMALTLHGPGQSVKFISYDQDKFSKKKKKRKR